jgi:hypothetical protein
MRMHCFVEILVVGLGIAVAIMVIATSRPTYL